MLHQNIKRLIFKSLCWKVEKIELIPLNETAIEFFPHHLPQKLGKLDDTWKELMFFFLKKSIFKIV